MFEALQITIHTGMACRTMLNLVRNEKEVEDPTVIDELDDMAFAAPTSSGSNVEAPINYCTYTTVGNNNLFRPVFGDIEHVVYRFPNTRASLQEFPSPHLAFGTGNNTYAPFWCPKLDSIDSTAPTIHPTESCPYPSTSHHTSHHTAIHNTLHTALYTILYTTLRTTLHTDIKRPHWHHSVHWHSHTIAHFLDHFQSYLFLQVEHMLRHIGTLPTASDNPPFNFHFHQHEYQDILESQIFNICELDFPVDAKSKSHRLSESPDGSEFTYCFRHIDHLNNEDRSSYAPLPPKDGASSSSSLTSSPEKSSLTPISWSVTTSTDSSVTKSSTVTNVPSGVPQSDGGSQTQTLKPEIAASSSTGTVELAVGSSVGSLAVIAVIAFFLLRWRRRRSTKSRPRSNSAEKYSNIGVVPASPSRIYLASSAASLASSEETDSNDLSPDSLHSSLFPPWDAWPTPPGSRSDSDSIEPAPMFSVANAADARRNLMRDPPLSSSPFRTSNFSARPLPQPPLQDRTLATDPFADPDPFADAPPPWHGIDSTRIGSGPPSRSYTLAENLSGFYPSGAFGVHSHEMTGGPERQYGSRARSAVVTSGDISINDLVQYAASIVTTSEELPSYPHSRKSTDQTRSES
ncbi:hypothetical protein CONPUDRAFT_156171 [Coniophora puteana RWD-64-598 SS2]|uniref:Uncharacterized protein n=1 Tax=Coniophora puteana (strain RWD-64-598) TaxID=741705 RepID=A0A5M3MFZ5_CONPW|nr:uncharacterized protein CONPUDRAFT_156171 [Coniophora puteana RWD-64-598 SS2]EIW78168.1 hypothetical protein CONPUDRAFT_156171 [Coniophora puteana RWD-64-598 SS2]